MIYIGKLKINNKSGNIEWFKCKKSPTPQSHKQYANVYGPFEDAPSADEYCVILSEIQKKMIF